MLLEAIFADIEANEQIYVWCKEPFDRRLFNTPAEVYAYAAERPSSDLYFGVAPRVRGSYDEVSRLTAIWADLDYSDYDNNPKRAAQALNLIPYRPSFVVCSGHGFHAYWLLGVEGHAEESQDVMRKICTLIGSDHTHDPTRILRIPGTYNCKDPTKPVPVEVLASHPERKYELEDIRRVLAIPVKTLQQISTGELKGLRSRSERDWHVLKELLRARISDEQILEIFKTHPIGDRLNEKGVPFFQQELKRAKEGMLDGDGPIQEAGDVWVFNSAKGTFQISTFVFDPIKILRDITGEEDAMLGSIKAHGEVWKDIVIPKSAFLTTAALERYLPNINWQWLGTQSHLPMVLLYLTGKLRERGMPEALGTSTIGRHDEYWVTKDATLSATKSYAPSVAPIVYKGRLVTRRGNIDTTPQIELPSVSDEEYTDFIRRMSAALPKVNLLCNTVPLIGWFMATPLKPLLEEAGYRFPLLNIYGTRGSGKTTMLSRVMHPLLGNIAPQIWTPNTTSFVLRALFAGTNAVPISFGEYRAATVNDNRNDILRTLLMSYDAGMDARGRPDLNTEVFLLSAPVTIDGEDTISDAAFRERAIILNFNPETIRVGGPHYLAMQELLRLRLSTFALRYMQRCLLETTRSVRTRMEKLTKEVMLALKTPVPDRVRRNLTVVSMGIDLYNEHVSAYGGETISWDAALFNFMLAENLMLMQNGVSRIAVDDFIEDIVMAVARPDTYRTPIMAGYDEKTNTLWFHLPTALHWWHRELRARGKTALELPALRAQLKERRDYVVGERSIKMASGTFPCYGILLEPARSAGLSVPSPLTITDVMFMKEEDKRGE